MIITFTGKQKKNANLNSYNMTFNAHCVFQKLICALEILLDRLLKFLVLEIY